MSYARRLLKRLRRLLHAADVERSMAAEFQHHLDCEIAERVATGLSPDAARREAVAAFGGVERIKEDARDARGTRAAEDLWRDASYAARVLRRHPAFTAGVTATFALAIAATAAILSVAYGVLERPLPYRDPERLVALWEHDLAHDVARNVVSLSNFQAWRERATTFAGMAALVPRAGTLAGDPVPERVQGAEVSPGYFTLLGIAPALGRDLRETDTTAIVVSDAFWKRRLAANPDAIGRSVSIDGTGYIVAGVMPPDFDPPRFGWLGDQEVWYPFTPSEQARSWGRFLLVVARLKPGVTRAAAESALAGIARQLERERPEDRGWSVSIVGLREQVAGDARPQLMAASASVTVLLALAVCNVATLTMSFVRRRTHELAVRRAIGATNARLFRQLFTQSLLLGLVGTAVGLIAAVPALRLLRWMLPTDMPRAGSIGLDLPVLGITLLVALAATTVFGVAAAAWGRGDVEGERLASAPRVSPRHRGAGVVIAEVALVLTLVVLALLSSKSLSRLRAVDVGFEPEDVISARVSLPPDYAGAERQRQFFAALGERVGGLPGVVSSGVISTRPFGGLGPATTVFDPSAPPRTGEAPVADVRYADAGFFAAMRIGFAAGGPCPASVRAPRVRGVVNQALARRLWPGRPALGRIVRVEMFDGLEVEVCGVARDVHLIDARTPPRPTVYLPFAAFPGPDADLVVRAEGDPALVVASLRTALAEIDSRLPLHAVSDMRGLVDRSMATDRFATFLIGAFAAVAFLLAAVGVFSVVLADVAARRREIGIRVALGEPGLSVVTRFLARALRQTAAGLLGGAALALAVSRILGSMLYSVSPTDPAAYAGAALLVTAIVLVAATVPSWLALRRSPLDVLRES